MAFLIGQSAFLPKTQETFITLQAIPKENGSYGEVWLSSFWIDGEEVPISKLQVTDNLGWNYLAEYDDYVFYPSEPECDNYITVKLVAENVDLRFAANPWSGVVRVQNHLRDSENCILYSEDPAQNYYDYSFDNSKKFSFLDKLILYPGLWIVIYFVLSFPINWIKNLIKISRFSERHSLINTQKKPGSGWPIHFIAIFCIFLLSFFQSKVMLPSFWALILWLLPFLIFIVSMEFIFGRRHKIKFFIPKFILLSTVLSIAFSLLFLYQIPTNIYYNDQILIEGTGQASKEAYSDEIWILDIQRNGESISLEDLSTVSWDYRNEALLYTGANEKAVLPIKLDNGEDVRITLLSHAWSGLVGLDFGSGMQYRDLYQKNPETIHILAQSSLGFSNPLLIEFSAIILIVFFTLYLSLLLSPHSYAGRFILSLFLGCALLCSGWLESWSVSAQFFLGSTLYFISWFALFQLEKAKSKWNKSTLQNGTFFILIVIISSFLGSYNQIVISPFEIRGGISAIGLCAAAVIYASLFGICSIALLKMISSKQVTMIDKTRFSSHTSSKKTFLFLTCVMILFWSVYWIAYFPGNMSPDSVDQWKMALGVSPLHDAHPLLSTLRIRFWSLIWKSPAIVGLIQIIFSAAIYAGIILSFIKRGIKKEILLLISISLGFMPNIAIYTVTLWKDVPFLLFLVIFTYLFHKFIVEEEFRFFQYLLFSISLFSVSLLRHNGILITLICSFIVLFQAIKRKSVQMPVVICLTFICIGIFKGPIFNKLGVEHYKMGLGATVMDCVGYTIYYDGSLPEDILEEALNEAPVSFWKEKFSPYIAHEYIFNGEKNLCDVYASKNVVNQIEIILRLFLKNPKIILHERLAMNDTNLFLYQSVSPNSLNFRYANSIYSNDCGLVQRDSKLRECLNSILYFTSENNFFDSILWRNGFAICCALWVIFFNFMNREGVRNVVLIPFMLNHLSLSISLIEPSYRYTHNIIICLMLAILFAIAPKKTPY